MPLLWWGRRSRWLKRRSLRLVEGDFAPAAEHQPAALADMRHHSLRRIGIDPLGPLAGKAEQDGAIGGVALPGQRERAVEIGLDPLDALEQAARAQRLDKIARRRHRSHRV